MNDEEKALLEAYRQAAREFFDFIDAWDDTTRHLRRTRQSSVYEKGEEDGRATMAKKFKQLFSELEAEATVIKPPALDERLR